MATTRLKIGIAGSGSAALAHGLRLLAVDGVSLVGCSDADPSASGSLATRLHTWLADRPASEHASRCDPRFARGASLADSGIPPIDAPLSTCGKPASLASAGQAPEDSGLALVTSA